MNNRDKMIKFFSWETWDNGDFEGWQEDNVNEVIRNWYNITIADDKEFFKILPMDLFISENKNAMEHMTKISQSVMCFSDEEVYSNMMGDFNEKYPFARFGYDNCTHNNEYCISMTRADISNWIMTHFGGNANVIVDWMIDYYDEESLNNVIDVIDKYLNI